MDDWARTTCRRFEFASTVFSLVYFVSLNQQRDSRWVDSKRSRFAPEPLQVSHQHQIQASNVKEDPIDGTFIRVQQSHRSVSLLVHSIGRLSLRAVSHPFSFVTSFACFSLCIPLAFNSLSKMKVVFVLSSLVVACHSFAFTSPVQRVATTTSTGSNTALFAANGEAASSGKKKVIVLGGDGFCGWPTSLYLSDQGHDVVIVDNLSRRNIDVELGCDSLTPIQSPEVSTNVLVCVTVQYRTTLKRKEPVALDE
jgi:hypothetical protein